MMFMCATRFSIEEKQLAFINQYLTNEEKEAIVEEKSAQLHEEDLINPISDDEEEGHSQSPSQPREMTGSPILVSPDRGDSGESANNSEDNDDDLFPLPRTQLATEPEESNQRKRVSTRIRVPSKRLKGYVVDL
jgi:hypothetical protein